MPRRGSTQGGGRYSFKEQGASSRGGLKGVYVLKDNAACQIYRPSWNRTHTVFRIFPGRNPENTDELDPFRLSDELRDYGDWIRRYDAVVSLGNPGSTFIIRDPMDDVMDVQQNPTWILFRTIDGAVKRGQCDPSWNPLRFGAAGRPAQLSAPADIYLVQGIVLEHRSKQLDPPLGMLAEQQTCVLMMSQSAGRALLDALDKRDAEGNYLYGDITDLDAGMYIDLHQAGTPIIGGPPVAVGQAAPMLGMGANVVGAGGVPQGNDMSANRYECTLLPDYSGTLPNLTQIKDSLLSKIKPWDAIVRHFTIEEQVGMICSAGLPATAVVYALQEAYGEHIPQHVYEQARASQGQQFYQPTGGAVGQPTYQQPVGGVPGQQLGGAPAPQQPLQQQQQLPFQQQQVPPVQTGPATLGQQAVAPIQNTPALAPGVPGLGVQAETPPAQPMPTQPPAAGATDPPGPASQQAEPQQAEPQQAGFDPQPTHADGVTADNTLAALEAARSRLRQAGGGQSG